MPFPEFKPLENEMLGFEESAKEAPFSRTGPPPWWQNRLGFGFPLTWEKVASKWSRQCSVMGKKSTPGRQSSNPGSSTAELCGRLTSLCSVSSLVKWE